MNVASDCAALEISLAAEPPPESASAATALQTCTFEILDMDCAACAIHIEARLHALPGVSRAQVHYATQRARIAFNGHQIDEAILANAIDSLGYTSSGIAPQARADAVRLRRKRFVWQSGLAAFCAMQIMMFSVPRYLGGDEIESALGRLLDGAALVLTLPVLVFCCGSFIRGAVRDWQMRRWGMDTAIVVSLGAAFLGSLWHLWAQSGSIYFDSIAMFVALLLAVRWWEWEEREKNRSAIEARAGRSEVTTVRRIVASDDDGVTFDTISLASINVDDRLRIVSGEAFPVDGVLLDAHTSCDESSLTGESVPVEKSRGTAIHAGSINLGVPVTIRATSNFEQSSARRLLQLADESARPEFETAIDRIAAYFLPTIAIAALATFALAFPLGISVAIERAIAVLIVSCPCALAIASPAARARAFAQLLSLGVIVRRSQSLQQLARAQSFLIDKTGTLTRPDDVRIVAIRDGYSAERAQEIIALLERDSNHPLACAITSAFRTTKSEKTVGTHFDMGTRSITGYIGNNRYLLSSPTNLSVQESSCNSLNRSSPPSGDLELSDEDGWICTVAIGESLRTGAAEMIDALQKNASVEILSGDSAQRVTRVADLLRIQRATSRCTPADKVARVRELQHEGRVVAMIGDGVNDSLGFAGADVAIAANGALDQLRASADLVLITEDLSRLGRAVDYSKQVSGILRQNISWAVAYNVIALPAAALGYVNPLLAAVGMAASSALVVANVARLKIG